jgi:hypothetical protein
MILRRSSLALALAVGSAVAAAPHKLGLRQVVLDLPGTPSKLVAADLDGDGLEDLAVVVAFTEIESVGGSRIEDMVEIATVIPELSDRRELWVYLAGSGGDYRLAGVLELPPSVLHLEHGPPGLGLVALTDEGLSRLRYDPTPGATTLALSPVLADVPVLAGTQRFYAALELVRDLDGDGAADVLFPSREGPSVYLHGASGLSPVPAQRIELPDWKRPAPAWSFVNSVAGRLDRWYPLPVVRDADGDGAPDLLFDRAYRQEHPAALHVLLGDGRGHFRPPRQKPLDCHDVLTDLRRAGDAAGAPPWPHDLVTLRDLDGDGRAEAVLSQDKPRGDSMRKELKDAKRPIQHYGFHRLDRELRVESAAYFETDVVGHRMEGGEDLEHGLPFHLEQFDDLDGDGREDLITLTLEFSIFQALKVLATKKIGVGIDFHVYAQRADGTFAEVAGLDLSEKLKFDLDNLELGRFAQFAGDFDGDGRKDFVHLGRGRTLTIHRGQTGCRYPKNPDLSIELEEAPPSLELVRIEDLDGDGRSDLRITRPLPASDMDTTAPARLELHLTRGAS